MDSTNLSIIKFCAWPFDRVDNFCRDLCRRVEHQSDQAVTTLTVNSPLPPNASQLNEVMEKGIWPGAAGKPAMCRRHRTSSASHASSSIVVVK